jgi:(2Fe-2S) ferredoxin
MAEQDEEAGRVEYHPPSLETRARARAKAEMVGVPQGQAHFFLCVGPDCCTPELGLDVWGFLKKRTRELEPELGGRSILRTKVGCLRICQSLGPNLVVYPSGRWYHAVDHANCERVLQYELFGRGSVEDLLIGRSGEAL